MKKLRIVVLAIIVAIVVTACGKSDDNEKNDSNTAQQDKQDITIQKDEKVDNNKVVVHVNDKEIKGALYNSIYVQTKTQLKQFGQDIDDKDKVKDQTLNELIAQELLIQDAADKGISVSKDELDREFNDFKKENKDQLNRYLKQYAIAENVFKDQFKVSLLLNKYIDAEIKVGKITDKEVKETYNELKKQNKDIPKLKDIEEMLKEQMVQQKQQEQLQSKIESLKKKATIKKMI